jgi:hypothetical protein
MELILASNKRRVISAPKGFGTKGQKGIRLQAQDIRGTPMSAGVIKRQGDGEVKGVTLVSKHVGEVLDAGVWQWVSNDVNEEAVDFSVKGGQGHRLDRRPHQGRLPHFRRLSESCTLNRR